MKTEVLTMPNEAGPSFSQALINLLYNTDRVTNPVSEGADFEKLSVCADLIKAAPLTDSFDTVALAWTNLLERFETTDEHFGFGVLPALAAKKAEVEAKQTSEKVTAALTGSPPI